MNACQLLKPGPPDDPLKHSPSGVWACSNCGTIAKHQFIAEKCCCCTRCGKPIDGDQVTLYRVMHDECHAKAIDCGLADDLAKATLVEGYNGFVWTSPHQSFETPLDAVEHFETIEKPVPEFAFCSQSRPVIKEDLLETAIDDALDDVFEDAGEHLIYPPELDSAWRRFVEANADLVTWTIDYRHKVRLPAARKVVS